VASNFHFCFAFRRPSIVDAFVGDGLFADMLATVGKQFVRNFFFSAVRLSGLSAMVVLLSFKIMEQ
jgi:hypothetical protein